MAIRSLTAQIMLPPKPKKETSKRIEKPEKIKLKRGFIDYLPARGWHGEATLGTVLWGIESQCKCNALAADVGFYYVTNTGLSIGSNLLLTSTVSSTLSPTLKAGYQHVRKTNGSLGNWSANVIAGPSIANVIKSSSIQADLYSGFVYGGEVGFYPRLGKYSQLKGILSIGWLTQRETFSTEGWGGGSMVTKMTHSGFRIRFGISI